MDDTLFDDMLRGPVDGPHIPRDAFLRSPSVGMPSVPVPLRTIPSPYNASMDASCARSPEEILQHTRSLEPRPMFVSPQHALYRQATNVNAWTLEVSEAGPIPPEFQRTNTPRIDGVGYTPLPFSLGSSVMSDHEYATRTLLRAQHQRIPIPGNAEQVYIASHHALQLRNEDGSRHERIYQGDWHHRFLSKNDPLYRSVQQLLGINDKMAQFLKGMSLGEFMDLHSLYLAVETEMLAWLYPPPTLLVHGKVSKTARE